MLYSNIKIPQFTRFKGNIELPGSKSIANRVLICSALSEGSTKIYNLPYADDIEITLKALKKLGISIDITREKNSISCEVISDGGPFSVKKIKLYLQNAGTALRPLTAILCASYGEFIIYGDRQMHRRPIRDLINGLQVLGNNITCTNKGTPPVKIKGSGLQIKVDKINLKAKMSSQFVSALLMALPLANKGVEIHLEGVVASRPYIDLTIHILNTFGISIEKRGKNSFFIPAPQKFISPISYHIEGDATASTYFLGAGALPGCGPISVSGLAVNSFQGDIEFIKLLKQLGANIKVEKNAIIVIGTKEEKLRAIDVDMSDMPDAAMTLAVLSLFCDGESHIRGIANLRIKESERVKGLRKELERLGAKVREEQSSLHITPPRILRSATIRSYNDHRMAMAFSLASYGTNIQIQNPSCVSKTYKGFFNHFNRLCN